MPTCWTPARSCRPCRLRRRSPGLSLLLPALLSLLWLPPGAARAGGPENVLLVVNADSWASLTIANHYQQLRQIPASHVVALEGVPGYEQVSVDEFRDRILQPIFQAMRERGLEGQIDSIIYSSDFPYAIDVRPDVARSGAPLPRVITPIASITGLTWLADQVLAKDVRYLSLASNRYVRKPLSGAAQKPLPEEDAAAYRAAVEHLKRQDWNAASSLLEDLTKKHPEHANLHYNLACCLVRLERLEEAIAALQQAVKAGWSNRRHAATDDDLEPLRERDDFQQLLRSMDEVVIETQPVYGFSPELRWSASGEPVSPVAAVAGSEEKPEDAADTDRPHRYFLSTMLAFTSGRGNSVREALHTLEQSVLADATFPKGTIYFPINSDIRSRTREPFIRSAVAQLQKLGVRAEIVEGRLPQQKDDVQGAVIGAAGFDWAASGSTIRPGAICEHLTSFGGVLRENAGQTPLTEFLRHGAAGASGAVTEPYAIQAKFPLPYIQVHYARGCTLAEAFYQSVSGPYQLLIVGDPLCRPWGSIPDVVVAGLAPGGKVQEPLQLAPAVRQADLEIDRYELWLDGRLAHVGPPGRPLPIGPDSLPARFAHRGFAEARVVAVSAGPLAIRGHRVIPVFLGESPSALAFKRPGEQLIRWGESITLEASCPDATTLSVLRNGRTLATVNGAKGSLTLDTRQLGLGPVELTLAARVGEAELHSQPLSLNILPPEIRSALDPPPQEQRAAGLLLTSASAESSVVVADTRPGDWLKKLELPPGERFTLEGWMEAPEDDVYQIQCHGNVVPEIAIDDRPLPEVAAGRWNYLPVTLEEGWHRIRITATAVADPTLQLRFGAQGTSSLSEKRFFHETASSP